MLTTLVTWVVNHPEAFIALAALLVSLASFYLTRHALAEQHRHNELSVRPHLQISRLNYKSRIQVSLHNRGLGPAIITSETIRLNGKVQNVDRFVDVMPESASLWTHFASRMPGKAIEPGMKSVLIELANERLQDDLEWADAIRARLEEIDVQYDYKDFYGNPFTVRKQLAFDKKSGQNYIDSHREALE